MTQDNHQSEERAETGLVPRVAVVGAGYWGRNLVRNFSELGALASVVDPDPRVLASIRELSSIEPRAWEAVLADRSIQGVAIAAPARMHFPLAQAALEAGKHVFVEKPLALELAEAERLIARAEKSRLHLMVGHLLQYHPAFLKLQDLLKGGQLGQLQYIYSNRLNFGKIRNAEDALWSLAPHDISMILSLVGEEPTGVDASGCYHLQENIADTATIHLSFPGGAVGHVFVSWMHPSKEQKLVVVGSSGMAVFDDGETWARKLLIYPHRVEQKDGVPTAHRAHAIPMEINAGEPLRNECQHFLDCMSGDMRPRTDGLEGLRVLRVLARATVSLGSSGYIATSRRSNVRNVSAVSSPHFLRFPKARIHESAYVDDHVEIGDGSAIWHFTHILSGVRIGARCVIGQNAVVGPDVTIGDQCKIQNNVSLYKGVTLEDAVFCGPSCVFTNVNNPRAEIERKSEFRETVVKRGATIGANSTIVCGHTLGEYCFIAAGAVVTKDVPAFALMAGNPARRIGWMSKVGIRLGPDLRCPVSGVQYRGIGSDELAEVE